MRRSRFTAIDVYRIAALLWAVVLTLFSAQSGESSGALSGFIMRILCAPLLAAGLSPDVLHLLVRKLAHFCGFAIEGFLVYRSMPPRLARLPALAVSIPACGAFAILNELQQQLSAGRCCSPTDMLIDTCGAALGAFVASMLRPHIPSSTKREQVKDHDKG